MKNYETLSEAINDLTKKGYILNFNIGKDCIECTEKSVLLNPDDFEIDEVHRFQDMSDVGDENILFAISSKNKKTKGLLVNAFGTYGDSASTEIIEKLESHFKT